VPASVTSCSFSGLTNGNSYTVSVTTTNALGSSPAVSASATPAFVLLLPTNLKATPMDGAALISWTIPAGATLSTTTLYYVTASPGAGYCYVNGTSSTSCVVSGLTNGSSYSFSIQAITTATHVGPSSPVTATPAPAPVTPSKLTLAAGSSSITASWQGPAGASYTATAQPGGFSCTTSTTSCTITGLSNGTSYSVTVAALTQGVLSASSAPAVATPHSTTYLFGAYDPISLNPGSSSVRFTLRSASGPLSAAEVSALASSGNVTLISGLPGHVTTQVSCRAVGLSFSCPVTVPFGILYLAAQVQGDTAPYTPLASSAAHQPRLFTGNTLYQPVHVTATGYLVSSNGAVLARLSGGQLVIFNSKHVLWHSFSSSRGATSFSFQGDGNLVFFSGRRVVAATNTHGSNLHLVLTAAGQLAIVSSANQVLWSSYWGQIR